MAAFNPRGKEPVGTADRDEGYLYWAGWLAHNGGSVYPLQDGNGLFRRIYFTASACNIQNLVTGGVAPDPADLVQVARSIITGIPLDLSSCS